MLKQSVAGTTSHMCQMELYRKSKKQQIWQQQQQQRANAAKQCSHSPAPSLAELAGVEIAW